MQKSTVITDKKTIRENITALTWREARRLKGPIYDALVQELCEENCMVAAKHMQCLAQKERNMLENNIIRIAVSQKPALLEKLFENVKTAENASYLKQCAGLAITFKLLQQCLQLLEEHGNTFDWLLEDLYKIIANICDKTPESRLNDSALRAMAYIYYNYGAFLSSRNLEMERAVSSLEKALKLSRSNNWSASGVECEEWDKCETLHAVIVTKLVSILLNYAMKFVNTDVEKALMLTREAINTVAEVKTVESVFIRCQAHLIEAKIHIQNEDYSHALSVLDHLSIEVANKGNWKYAQMNCELILYKGICYDGLGDMARAQHTLRQALFLSKKFNFVAMEAKCCFKLGRLHAHRQDELMTAKRYLDLAKQLYTKLGKLSDLKKVLYQLAKLESKRFFPLFMDLLKSYEERYCCFYHLRNWKNLCKPFWPAMNQQLFEKQLVEAHCLLDNNSDACINSVYNSPILMLSRRSKKLENDKKTSKAPNISALEDIRHSSIHDGDNIKNRIASIF